MIEEDPQTLELRRLGHSPKRLKPTELAELAPKHRRLIGLMVHGDDTDACRALTRPSREMVDGLDVVVDRPIEPGQPLKLEEAAKLLGIRLKQARELFAYPRFQTELNQEVMRLRESAKPAAMQRLIALRDREGAGKAADAKVQLAAAQALLGDVVGQRQSVQVNVGVQAGYTIDLSGGAERTRTVDMGPAGTIIEADEE